MMVFGRQMRAEHGESSGAGGWIVWWVVSAVKVVSAVVSVRSGRVLKLRRVVMC